MSGNFLYLNFYYLVIIEYQKPELFGKWEEEKFGHLIPLTGMSAKQLNKWFWDRKKKEDDSIKAKKMSYPGLIFHVYNIKSGKDLTPAFPTLVHRVKIFTIQK